MAERKPDVRKKRFIRGTLGEYQYEVQDYGYKSRAPVSVRVSGLTLGECVNYSREPCYFYRSADAYSMEEGLAVAESIITKQQQFREGLPCHK